MKFGNEDRKAKGVRRKSAKSTELGAGSEKRRAEKTVQKCCRAAVRQ